MSLGDSEMVQGPLQFSTFIISAVRRLVARVLLYVPAEGYKIPFSPAQTSLRWRSNAWLGVSCALCLQPHACSQHQHGLFHGRSAVRVRVVRDRSPSRLPHIRKRCNRERRTSAYPVKSCAEAISVSINGAPEDRREAGRPVIGR